MLPSLVCEGLTSLTSSWSRASALLFRWSRKGGDSSGVSGVSESRDLDEGCNCGAIGTLVDALRELTAPSLAIPWELVLKSSCSADGIVLSHNCLVKTIWGWAWEGSVVDDVVGDDVENLGSDRGTRMTDIGKGTARNALFCCQNAVFDLLMLKREQRYKDGGSRPLFNNAYASPFFSPEPAIGPAILCIMTSDCTSGPIVLTRSGETRRVVTDNPSWHFFVLMVGKFPHAGKSGQGETFRPNARRLAEERTTCTMRTNRLLKAIVRPLASLIN